MNGILVSGEKSSVDLGLRFGAGAVFFKNELDFILSIAFESNPLVMFF